MADLSSLEGQQQLRALAEAATSGPWEFDPLIHGDPLVTTGRGHFGGVAMCSTSPADYGRANALFIAAAREAVPALLDLVQQLTDENRQLRQTLRDVKRIGSSSGINLNAWNLAFNVIDAALSPVAASSGGTPE